MLVFALGCAAPAPERSSSDPTLWPVTEVALRPLPPDLADLAWLADTSTWRSGGGSAPGRAGAGSWGLGNGRVFALEGLDAPANTLTNVVGPGYQRQDGFFGDGALGLLRDGIPATFEEEQVERVRGTAVVRTAARAGTVWLQTVDVADGDTILRHVSVWTDGADPVSGLALLPTLAGSDGLSQSRGGHTLVVDCPLDPLPPVGPDTPWTGTCAWIFDGASPRPVRDALLDHRATVAAFLGRAAALETPDPKVDDLYEGLLLTEWTQTDGEGVVSPMSRYTGAWLRDTEGPVRLYVAAGLFEEAAAALDGIHALAVGAGAIANSYPLDGPRGGPTPDWSTVPFMAGRNPVEAPSYPPILDAVVRRAWGRPAVSDETFLRACVERQVVADGLLAFSGDETFRYPMAAVVGGLPEELGWSANSAFLWVAAAEAVGVDADEVRATTAATFWTGEAWSPLAAWDTLDPFPDPYEEVSPQAARLGFSAEGLDALAATLLQDDGTLRSSGAIATTGMVPGYALDALGDGPDGARLFDALDLVATPSGHFEELHGVDLAPLDLTHLADGTGADVTARYRPWEGGIVGAAMLAYLFGADPDAAGRTLTLDPHLPDTWPGAAMRRLRLGDERYDVEVERVDGGLAVTVRRGEGEGDWAVTVDGDRRTLAPGAGETWEPAG